MKILAIDTETSYVAKVGMHVPFLATTCDESLKCKAYEVRTIGNFKEKKNDVKALKKICVDKKILKVFHNAPYDIAMLHNIDIEVATPYVDTLNAAGILNENFSPKGLKPLATNYLNEPCNEEKILSKIKNTTTRQLRKSGVLGKKEDLPWHFLPRKEMLAYALNDPYYTMKLWYLFHKPLQKYKAIFDFEMEVIPITVAMYLNGLRLDRKFVQRTLDEYIIEQSKVTKSINKMLKSYGITYTKTKVRKSGNIEEPISFNIRSNQHKSKVLAYLKVPVPELSSGYLSTDQKILEPYRQQFPFVQAIADFGWYEKQLSTYYTPFLRDHTTEKNDIAHFSYYQSAAKSGRYTASRIHQIPRLDEEQDDPRIIRQAFIAPKNGWIVTNDYDQIEMRLFAHYTKSKLLIQDFLTGKDPYTNIAVNVGKRLGIDILAMSKQDQKAWRRRGKGCCLGVIYGMGKDKTAQTLKLPTMEAFEFLNYFYELYPVREYMDNLTAQLYKKGFITIALDSELMKFSIDKRIPQELAYKGVNMQMQCVAGLVMKAGMLRCWKKIRSSKALKKVMTVPWTGLPAIHGTIHDEIIFYIFDKKRSVAIEITQELQELMNDRITFKVPITTSPKISNESWGLAKSI